MTLHLNHNPKPTIAKSSDCLSSIGDSDLQVTHAAWGTAYRCFKLPVLSVAPNFLVSGLVHQSTFRTRILTGAGAGGQFCHLPFSYWLSMLLKAWSRPNRPISFYFESAR